MGDVPEADGLNPQGEAVSLMRFAGLVLDLDVGMLSRESGEAIKLTRGEFAILRVFVTRPGRVISRDTLLDALSNRRFEPFDRSVDVLVGRLRRKIEPDPRRPSIIVTVPGSGYRFAAAMRTGRPTASPKSEETADQPGTIYLSDDAYRQVKGRLDLPASDLGEQKLKNIAEPVRAYALDIGKLAEAKAVVAKQRSMLVPVIARIIALIAIGGGAAWFLLGTPKPVAAVAANAPVQPRISPSWFCPSPI
jgi:DNA-binding winged helix-turn-helix (wHTH) protein